MDDDAGTETGDGGESGDGTGDAAADERPNLLLVCVDCLREDLLRSDRTETPYLDSLREAGLACRDLYASATTTTPAVASLLTGSYAERNGVYSLQRGSLAADVDPLAALLPEEYHTEGLATGPLVPETGLDRGFDAYDCRPEDASMFTDWRETAIERLGGVSEPFFAFVHLWELHEDIHVPSAYDAPEYGETPYERALSALDDEIRTLVEATPENTLVAVVGDHGESITHRNSVPRLLVKSTRDALRYFGGIDTRGVVGRLNRALDDRGPDIDDHYVENGHGENVYDFTTNVPFLLHGPGVESATVDAQVRQIDVLPTLLSALDVDAETDGDPVGPGVEDRVAYMRACGASLHRERNWARAVRSDETKLVTYPERDWSAELYDLDADPREHRRLENPDREAELRRLLPERGTDPTDVETIAVEDRLKDLGYL